MTTERIDVQDDGRRCHCCGETLDRCRETYRGSTAPVTAIDVLAVIQQIAEGDGDAELLAIHVHFALSDLIDAAIDAHDFAANTARNEGRGMDRRFYRLRAALARVGAP